MNKIMTIQLPDGENIHINITNISRRDDSFTLYEGRERNSGEVFTIRVDDEESFNDLKKRNIL